MGDTVKLREISEKKLVVGSYLVCKRGKERDGVWPLGQNHIANCWLV
jgi:hypothetical protein